ncbi:MAG: 6-carboxytetrahydropterin synthase QueD [Phycisphaerae bacterium]|nr:6-carboxytetrahydropterin synthase QueD [Phycisphaerae bacterium]
MRVQLTKTFDFDAAHHLPTFPEGHKCRGPHGHGFRVAVRVEGEVDEAKGYLLDFGEITAACEPIRKKLDHAYLNEIAGLENPTAENLARWIWQRLKPQLPLLSAVIVYESATSACEYRGE